MHSLFLVMTFLSIKNEFKVNGSSFIYLVCFVVISFSIEIEPNGNENSFLPSVYLL